MRQLRLFLMAVMFYTRLPVPAWTGYSDDELNASTRYFPVIGWIVGSVVAGVALGASYLLPLPVAVVLGVSAGVLLTGGFHEDGLGDLIDGFGGGTTRERTLDIMKDSRVGSYASLGLLLSMALRITTLVALLGQPAPGGAVPRIWLAVATILWAHVLSRWCVVTMIYTHRYARDDLTSKVKPIGRKISRGELAIATIWLLPFIAWFIYLGQPWALAAVLPAYLAKAALGRWFTRRLGGYTGDCLGASQQLIELLTLVLLLGLGKYL